MQQDTAAFADQLQRQFDERAIVRVINTYASRVDQGDIDGVMACFDDTCSADYGGGAFVLADRAEIRRFLESSRTPAAGPSEPSSHFMTNVLVELSGDAAQTETTAMAVRHLRPGYVTVRGLRYHDRFARTPRGWLIRHRRHVPVWEFEAPGQPSSPFAR